MPPEQPPIFRHFESYGGLADFSTLHDDVKLLWQLPARYLADALEPARLSRDRPNEEFPSYVAYIKNGSFNAAIRHEQEIAAAGIFAGVPILAFQACRLFALRMDQTTGLPLCDSRERLIVFQDRIAVPLEWTGLTGEPSRNAWEEVNAFERATGTTNNELATFMFDIGMRYVAMHECMHFALGHARYCQINLGNDVFQDASDRRAALDPITSQTLEFIADRHVVSGLAVDLSQGRLYHEWSQRVPAFVAVAPEIWYRRILFSTLALISRLWANHGARTLGDLSQPYPHPYERVCWMLSGLSEIEGSALHHESALAFALSVGSLDRNYETSREDIPVLTRDAEIQDLTSFSALDHGYSVVRQRAVEIQKVLYEQYGAFYPPQET
jgi:hypothetical protein